MFSNDPPLSERDATLAGHSPVPETIKARHLAFLSREQDARPLVGVYKHSIYPMREMITYLKDGLLEPTDLQPEMWIETYEQNWLESGLMWGDLIGWTSPLNGFPWMEAIAGCPIHVSQISNSVWAEPAPDFCLGDNLRIDPHNPWLELLLQSTEALVAAADSRFPIAPGIMRGISDLMAALLGSSSFYLALHDEPRSLHKLAKQLGALWIIVISAQYEIIPEFSGGYVNAGIWTPDPCPVYQDDAASLISAEDYEHVIGPQARRILQHFKNPIMHLHSTGLQILPSLLKLAPPPIIEINIDPTGPTLDRLLPIFREAQTHASLELFGEAQKINTLIQELSPRGLACLIQEPELENYNG